MGDKKDIFDKDSFCTLQGEKKLIYVCGNLIKKSSIE